MFDAAVISAIAGAVGTAFVAFMAYRQKVRDVHGTLTVETMRAEDRFRDDLMSRLGQLAGRIDQLQHQNDVLHRENVELRQKVGELSHAYQELEDKYVRLKVDYERQHEENERMRSELDVARRMLDSIYKKETEPPPRWPKGASRER